MIVVRYSADGMKCVVMDDVGMADFWEYFRIKRDDCTIEMEKRYEEHEAICENATARGVCYTGSVAETSAYRTGGNSFEVTDEALASGCTQYVARPDDWPLDNGEPR